MTMYNEFFGLRESPFSLNPDPRYFFLTPAMQEALAGLAYGIQRQRGIVVLTGEVGTGKTTLLNQLMDWLRQNRAATTFIFNTRLSVEDLFDYMLSDFGRSCEPRAKSDTIRLNNWLLDRHVPVDREPAVLIVDEAQTLTLESLKEIRLLTNLETSSEKLLQIVLSGQPELELKLRDPRLGPLRRRITLRCRTQPLLASETRNYIEERLHIAGANGDLVFSREAIESIHHHARGVPRVVNVLCDHALTRAFAARQKPVSAALVHDVARELELDLMAPMAAVASTESEQTGALFQPMFAATAMAARSFAPKESLLTDFAKQPYPGGSSVPARVE